MVGRRASTPSSMSAGPATTWTSFAPQLRTVGFGTFDTIELGELDLTAANFKRAQIRAGGPAAPRLGMPAAAGEAARLAYQQTPASGNQPRAEEGERASALLDRAIAVIEERTGERKHQPPGA